MQKQIIRILLVVFCLQFVFLSFPRSSHGISAVSQQTKLEYYDIIDMGITPIPCGTSERRSCPREMLPVYEQLGETCARSFDEFVESPQTKHFWIEDPQVTEQGKADERARQYVWWAINRDALDNAVVLRQVWGVASSMAFFFVIIVVVIFGIGFIISSRTNFQLNIKLWPTIMKVAMMLLYVALSMSILLIMIQLAEMLMNFFIETLGGKDLFNIYFTNATGGPAGQGDSNYTNFVGCRDLNIRVNEAVNTQMFMLDLTNISYYTMGTMILLRKILLWFLIFASPFLAILMPFIFIRNIGWIWIGVFFQWLFYGPLLALFLGAMNAIWTAGIPFNFDFSRVVPFNRVQEGANDSLAGYTYPTGINILYGGPAQINNGVANRGLSAVNNGNYIDTFTEYVISLIMIWAVTFFPWWLLRIFRDLCCDGIYATRNILLAWYNQWSSTQGRPPVQSKVQPQSFPSIKVEAPKVKVVQQQTQVKTKLQSVEQIRSTKTVDVPRVMNIEAKRLTDIAKMETNSSMRDTVKQNLMNLANPAKAETSKERETLMNLRTELFNRSVKKDMVAQRILASTSQSKAEQIRQRQEIVKSIPKLISISASVTAKVKVSEEKSNAVMNKYMQSLSKNNTVVNNISKKTQIPQDNVRKVLNSYAQQASQPAQTAVKNIATQTNMAVDKVKEVLKEASRKTQRSDVVKKVSSQNQIRKEQVSQIFKAISSSIQKTKEKTLPPTFAPKVAQAMNVPVEKAQSIIASLQETRKAIHQQKIESSHVTNITNNETAIKQIEQKTGMQSEQVKQVMNSYAQNVSQPVSQAIEKIASETKTDKEKVKEVIKETNNTIKQQQTIQQTAEKEKISAAQTEQIMNAVSQVESQDVTEKEQSTEKESSHSQVSKNVQVSEEKAKNITDAAFQAISNNEELVNTISEHTGLKKEQIQITLDTFSKNMDKPADELAEQIEESAGVEKEKVQEVMDAIGDDLADADDIVDEVAEAEEIDPEEVSEIMSASLPVAAEPEEHIEESVGIPPNIAVEDYEEVRNMWTDQYENGEVPVTENVQARDEWVEQDIVMITNTLNKLMSDDEQMKQEGLDELGFIIPVFMINNLKGEELVVYLKAKLEAAKTVKKQIDMEKKLREEILGEKQKEEEETLLEVDRSEKKEEQKHMSIDLEEQQKEEAAVKERLKKLGEE